MPGASDLFHHFPECGVFQEITSEKERTFRFVPLQSTQNRLSSLGKLMPGKYERDTLLLGRPAHDRPVLLLEPGAKDKMARQEKTGCGKDQACDRPHGPQCPQTFAGTTNGAR